MWFPPIQPSHVVGRKIWLHAHFLGVARLKDQPEVSGLAFLAGREAFLLIGGNVEGMGSLQFEPVPLDGLILQNGAGVDPAPDSPAVPVPVDSDLL